MKTPNEDNGNGDTLDDMMNYDDLLTALIEDREDMINILTESRIQTLLKEEDIVTVLINHYKYNGIKNDSEYYLRDESELREELFKNIHNFYSKMNDLQIIIWYKENEPYVFGMRSELEKLFSM